MVGVFLCVDIIILSVWQGVDPLTPQEASSRVVRISKYLSGSIGKHDLVTLILITDNYWLGIII